MLFDTDMKLIFDYIQGNALKNIEVLEDNVSFMIKVIEYSNDKRMYNLCSENVKKDFKFVKYIIQKFKKDINFISMVADNYIDLNYNSEEFFNSIEISIIMENIIGDTSDLNLYKYKMNNLNLYEDLIAQAQLSISNSKLNKDDKEFLGLGFYQINNYFLGRNEILRYFAKKMTYQIFFEDEKLTFEQLIHQNVDKYEKIEKIGVNNFLINFIGLKDINLAGYISANISLLNDVKLELEKVKKRFNTYNENIIRNKLYIFEERMLRYYRMHEDEIFSYDAIVYSLMVNFNLVDVYKKYLFDHNDSNKYFDEEFLNPKFLSLGSYKFYKYGYSQLDRLFRKNSIYKPKKIPKNNKAKILKLNIKDN